MANNKEIITRDIIFNIKAKITDAEKAASGIQAALSKVNISKDLKESLSGALVDLTSNIDKLKGKLTSTMSSSDIEKWNRQWSAVSDTLTEIISTFSSKKISSKDVLFDEATQKRLNTIEDSLREINEYKTKLAKGGAIKQALVGGLSPENQIKQNKELGISQKTQQDIYSFVANNLDNEKIITEYIERRAPKNEQILAAEQKKTDILAEQVKLLALQDSFKSSKGTDANKAIKKELVASPLVDTTGLTEKSTKVEFSAAIKASVESYTNSLREADEAIIKLQTDQERLAYQNWGAELIKSAGQISDKLKLDEQQAADLTEQFKELVATGIENAEAGLRKAGEAAQTTAPALERVSDAAEEGASTLTQLGERDRFFRSIQSRITQIFGLANAFNLLRTFIRQSIKTISELDAAFTQIAVVTDKTTSQLWKSFDIYNDMAQSLGTTTSDAIETSALYYQQGLDTAEVMKLTTETIKMARIANMDYSASTEAMTSAIRGFKMDMNNATEVVDVYSALAAKSAVDTQQLAVAISKVASIANSAGMTLQSTSAFLSQIIETTQEAPETAGTALKTIIARFTEMKTNIGSFKDEEGELVDVNKVETALRGIGVALRDSITGQMRDVDDVFLELASKWEGLDRNTQRYISTIAAGARQQSRFIAMMDNYKRTMELIGIANDAAGASTSQFNKTLDSVQAKANQVKANFESIIGNLINNEFVRGLLTAVNNVMKVLSNLAKMGPVVFVPIIIGIVKIIESVVKTSTGLFEFLFKNAANTATSTIQQTTAATENNIQTWISKIRSLLANANWEANIDVKANGQNIDSAAGTKGVVGGAIGSDKTSKTITAKAQGLSLALNAATTIVTTALAASGKTVAATGATVGSTIGGAIGSIWGPVGSAIGTAAGAVLGGTFSVLSEIIQYGSENTQAQLDKAKKIASELAQEQSEFNSENANLEELGKTVNTLTEKIKDGVSLTAEETIELATAQDTLGKSYNGIVIGRDTETSLLQINTKSLNDLILARQAEAESITASAAAATYAVNEIERARENKGNKAIISDAYTEMFFEDDIIDNNLSALDDKIKEELSNPDAETIKAVDNYLIEFQNLIAEKFPKKVNSASVINYTNEIRRSIGIIQENLIEQQNELNKLGNFSVNIVKDIADKTAQGQDIPELSKAMISDLSSIMNVGFAEAIKNKPTDIDTEDEIVAYVKTQIQNQLDTPIADVFRIIAESGEQEKYNAYSALLPYFKGIEGGIDTALTTLGVDAASSMGQALTAASEIIIGSTLPDNIQNVIRTIATTSIEDANKLALSLMNFNIDTASITELDTVRDALHEMGYDTIASDFIIELDNQIATLGYTSDEANASLQTLIGTLTGLTNLESKSKTGTLTESDVIDLVSQYGTELGFSIDNFSFDLASGGYSGTEIPWNEIRLQAAQTAVESAQEAIKINRSGIQTEMSEIAGEALSVTQSVANLMDLMQREQQGEDVTSGMTSDERTSYGTAKDYFSGINTFQQQATIAQQVVDLGGMQAYATAVDSAIAKSQKLAKSNRLVLIGFELTEAEIDAIKKKYPQLSNRIDNVNESTKDYISVMNEVNDLETAEKLEEIKDNVSDYLDSIEGVNESSQDFLTAMQGIASQFGEGIGAEFVAENIDLIRQASEGSYTAFQELQAALAEEILLQVGSNADLSNLMNGLTTVAELGQEATDALVKSGMFEVVTEILSVPTLITPWGVGGWIDQPVRMLKPVGKTVFNRSFGGGKKGGGGKKDDYSTKADKYYNEIQAISALQDKLEKLSEAREKGNLTPKQYRANIDETIKYYKELQNKLHEYNNLLRADQAKLINDINMAGYGEALKVVNGQLMVNKSLIEDLSPTTQKTIDDQISAYEDLSETIAENSDEWMKAQQKQLDLLEESQQAYLDLEQKIIDILIEQHQKEIENTQKKYDALKKADNDYLEALRDNIDKRRKARDKEESYSDLAKKEKRLALLKRDTSGIYASEILALEEEITQQRQDLADQETDDMVTNLEEQAKTRSDAYDEELEELNNFQKDREESMTYYNQRANEIMAQGYDQLMSWFMQNDTEYMTATATAQQQYIQSWQDTINTASALSGLIRATGGMTAAQSAAHAEAEAARRALSSITSENPTASGGETYALGARQISSFGAEGALAWYNKYVKDRTDLSEKVKALFWQIVVAKFKYDGEGLPSGATRGFSQGGLVDYTGLAMVHGSTTDPEAFLSADDTHNFQTLAQLLSSAITYNGASSETPEGGGTTVMGDINITIEVAELGDDYDVEQMVEKVKQEIVNSSNYRNVNLINKVR